MRVKILPTEEKFFVLFEQQAQYIADAAKLLSTSIYGGSSQLGACAAQIREVEHKGDEVTHEIMTRLNQTFLTPIDPEDIHRLASRLDDVLDMIDAAVGFKLSALPPALHLAVDVLELRVAVRVGIPLLGLAVGLETVAQLLQQLCVIWKSWSSRSPVVIRNLHCGGLARVCGGWHRSWLRTDTASVIRWWQLPVPCGTMPLAAGTPQGCPSQG